MTRARLAITTAVDKTAASLSALASDHGLDPVALPCVEVTTAPAEVLGEAGRTRADWIVVTSARAIETIWPDGGMPEIPVAVVGSSTAKAVRDAGGVVSVVGDAGADTLLEHLGDRVSGRSVLFPHAAGADPSTVANLEAVGARVTALAVYEITPIGPASDPVDAVLFGSPSAVAGWSSSRDFDDMVLTAIGPTTSSALSDLGYQPHVVPLHPDFAELIELVANHLSDRSPV